MIAISAVLATCSPKVGPTTLRVEARSPLSSPKASLERRAATAASARAGSRPEIWTTFAPKLRVLGLLDLGRVDARDPGRRRARRGPRRRSPARPARPVIRVPDSKSIPRLSCLVANAIAPIARITPESGEEALRGSGEVEVPAAPARSPAPRKRRRAQEAASAPSRPRTAWVKSTAVNSETIVPMPSVKAKPLTPAVASTKRMNAVIRVITFASMIVAMPLR